MPSIFIGAASENFQRGRPAGLTPEAIVLHRTGGTRDFWRVRFNQPVTAQSAHYVVGREGAIDQYVLETDTAFHAGLMIGSTWPRLRPNVNPNFYTIGIELEGGNADDWPDTQIEAAAALIAGVAGRWRFPIDAERVIAHRVIRVSSRCPADSCPINRIIDDARNNAVVPRTSKERIVRTLFRTNLRRGTASVQAAIARVIPADTEVVVSGFIDNGERVQGNSFWYCDEQDGFFWAGATSVPEPTVDDGASSTSPADTASTDPMELATRPTPAPPALVNLGGLAIDRTTFVLPPKEFAGEVVRKDLVVLHFTAGTTAKSAFDSWRNDPQRVATAYLVDADGSIYEVFPPEFWAAHLGIKGTQNFHDKRSIGIEIANVGPLKRASQDPSVLNWWPPKFKGAPEFTTKFCRLDETHRYIASEYRGKSHFASFPAAQVDAVASLVRGLCDRFDIPATLPTLGRRFECDLNRFASYRGVGTHANFRQDKWDIGPAFPWERLGL